jgi:adenylate cyclase
MGLFERLFERLSARWLPVALSLLIVLLAIARGAGYLQIGLIDRLEHITYDWRVLAGLQRGIDPRVVIVDIDERSLLREGRWPWSRDILALLVERIFETHGAAVLGFDIVFAEPDTSSGLPVLERLAREELAGNAAFQEQIASLRPRLDHDRRLAETIARFPVVLGYYFNAEVTRDGATRSGSLPRPTLVAGSFQGRRVNVARALGYGANLEIFQQAAHAAGHFNPMLDLDGIVRRVPMLYEYGGNYYESLSIAIARTALGIDELRLHFEDAPWGASRAYAGLEWLELGSHRIPVDENVQALIPYRSRQGGFTYVSATDVLRGSPDLPPDLMRGRIVLVGTTAPGLFDLRATPVQENYPGVEVHANLITGILDGAIKAKPAYVLGAEAVMLCLFGLLLALVLPLVSPLQATAAYAGATLLLTATNLLVWSNGLVLPLASPLTMMTLQFVLQMSYGYFLETRGKRQLTNLFGQYVPPELVDEMSRAPENYSLEAESRELTVLFSDVRGFTSISEGLPPPKLARLINDFLTPMTRIIHANRGTIDKYMGDAVMAFWGAPIEDPEHAAHAVQTALEMVKRAEQLSQEFMARGLPPISIGVGLNTGQMSVGNMGSEFRMAYTVLGDAVNLGSRLEGLTKEYGVSIIVSESTRRAAPGFVYRELDQVKVKGKEQSVTIHEPLCRVEELSKELKDELKVYRQGLDYYRARNWDLAEVQFLALVQQSRNPGLYRKYAERCAWLRAHPPGPDWTGVFAFKTK